MLVDDNSDPIPGKEGVVKKVHALGDMADVDFGNGDVYGITFRRMMKLWSTWLSCSLKKGALSVI